MPVQKLKAAGSVAQELKLQKREDLFPMSEVTEKGRSVLSA